MIGYGVVGGAVAAAGAPLLGLVITGLGFYLWCRDQREQRITNEFIKNNPDVFKHLWK